MDLYLIRHGKHDGDLENDQGRFIDQGLSQLGHQQAAALAAWIIQAVPTLEAIYTSTLQRSQQTATYLGQAYDLNVIDSDLIREVSCNRADHTPWPNTDIPARSHGVQLFSQPFTPVSPDDGQEAGIHVLARVGLFITALVQNHPNEAVAVVCHGGIIDVMLSQIFNSGLVRPFKVFTSNTGLAYLSYHPDQIPSPWSLFYLNRLDHLCQQNIAETL